MTLPRFARRRTAPIVNPLARLPAPSRPVDAATVFADETLYRVKLSGVAEYLGSSLSPMHIHTIKGKVAAAIRAKIAAFDPA
jgi:hypothetical protein